MASVHANSLYDLNSMKVINLCFHGVDLAFPETDYIFSIIFKFSFTFLSITVFKLFPDFVVN